MAEENTEKSKKTWFKALLGTAAGLMSGAFMMYLSPLLDKVVKPSKPVANFAVDLQGLTVTFHNRSFSKGDGWWDFGDGSPLEPTTAGEESATHSYAKSGTYTVKLVIRNILNEESERSVTINLDNSVAEPPVIVSLEAVPVSASSYAPATFRLVTRTKNASLCVWDLDEDRPLDIVADPPEEQDRLVTFNNPGGYIVKLAAVNGKQAKEKSVIINVEEPPSGMLTAVLSVSEQMTQVEKAVRPVTLTEAFTANAGTTQAINRRIEPRPGFSVVDARLDSPSVAGARGLTVKVLPDRKAALLTGELVKDASATKGRAMPVVIRTRLTEEKRLPLKRPAVPVMAAVGVPGSTILTLPTLPPEFVDLQRQYRLELRDGDRVIWQDSRLPHNVQLTVNNRRCVLNATAIGDQVRIDLADVKPGRNISAN